jgi:hypothetical protein
MKERKRKPALLPDAAPLPDFHPPPAPDQLIGSRDTFPDAALTPSTGIQSINQSKSRLK